VRHNCLEPLGLSVTEWAKVLGVMQAMNNLVSGKAEISAEMVIRLKKDFGSGAET
jgi:antitoxin HigA-1